MRRGRRPWPARVMAAGTCAVLAACSPGEGGEDGGALRGVTGALTATPPSGPGVPERWAGSPEDREAVLGVAEGVLRAINEADGVLMQGLLADGATVTAIGAGRTGEGAAVTFVSGPDFIQGISDPDQGYGERIWDPEVRIQGDLATVWAPYDFYIGGTFSHCGIDTFQLVRTGRGWRVQGIVYSRSRPPACETHPAGAPGS